MILYTSRSLSLTLKSTPNNEHWSKDRHTIPLPCTTYPEIPHLSAPNAEMPPPTAGRERNKLIRGETSGQWYPWSQAHVALRLLDDFFAGFFCASVQEKDASLCSNLGGRGRMRLEGFEQRERKARVCGFESLWKEGLVGSFDARFVSIKTTLEMRTYISHLSRTTPSWWREGKWARKGRRQSVSQVADGSYWCSCVAFVAFGTKSADIPYLHQGGRGSRMSPWLTPPPGLSWRFKRFFTTLASRFLHFLYCVVTYLVQIERNRLRWFSPPRRSLDFVKWLDSLWQVLTFL